jgi:hypothetical protein
MTSHAGRHRMRLSAQRPQSLLLLDYPGGDDPPGVYLNRGIVPNGSRLISPGRASAGTGLGIGTGQRIGTGPGIGTGQTAGRRAIRAALVKDRRAFAIALSAGLAGVAAAAVFGRFAPLHSTWMTGGRHGAAGGLPPQAPVPWSAAPLGSPSGQATPPSPSEPATSPPRPRRTGEAAASTRPPGQAPVSRTGPTSGTGPGIRPTTAASTGTRTRTASRSMSAKARPESKVVVRYFVDSQGFGGFQGQVQVVNEGTQPIAGRQIVIALPDDTVTAVQNAGGFVSHGILLLQPADVAEVVPPGGGTLNVFFVAEGTETIPAACAFNGIACG